MGLVSMHKEKVHFEQIPIKVVKKILQDDGKRKQSARTIAIASIPRNRKNGAGAKRRSS